MTELKTTKDIENEIKRLKKEQKRLQGIEIEKQIEEKKKTIKLGDKVSFSALILNEETKKKEKTNVKGEVFGITSGDYLLVKYGKQILKRNYKVVEKK